MNWYILQVHSGTEKKVEKELLAQLEKKGLKKNIDEILIPSEDVIEMKKGKKVNTERKFFPGYMMIKMIMDDEIWHTVRTIPKVYGFLGGKKGEPIPVSQTEIDSIFNQMKAFLYLEGLHQLILTIHKLKKFKQKGLVHYGKKNRRLYKIANSCRTGKPLPSSRAGIRTKRCKYNGIL